MIHQNYKYGRALQVDPYYPHKSNEELYQHLANEGYYWDNDDQKWIYSGKEENDKDENEKIYREQLLTEDAKYYSWLYDTSLDA